MKTNELKYETVKFFDEDGKLYKLVVTIYLGDCHKNGICSFSITADLYCKNNNKWLWECGGCIHDLILKYSPEFKLFVQLHLCNRLGQPFNREGIYYWLGKVSKEVFCNNYRVTEDQYDKLASKNDKDYFKYLLFELGIVDQWKKDAEIAITKLEKLTGNIWVNPYEKEKNVMELTLQKRLDIEKRVKSGYYSVENILARKKIARQNEIKEARKKILNRFDNRIVDLQTEKLIKLYIFDNGIMCNNHIYYPSRKEVVFNWTDSEDHITEKEFNDFLEKIDYSRLPDGITFKIKQ